jgi:hypothetical protein
MPPSSSTRGARTTFGNATLEHVVANVLMAPASESTFRCAFKEAGVSTMIDVVQDLDMEGLQGLRWTVGTSTEEKRLSLIECKRILWLQTWYDSHDDKDDVDWLTLTANSFRDFRANFNLRGTAAPATTAAAPTAATTTPVTSQNVGYTVNRSINDYSTLKDSAQWSTWHRKSQDVIRVRKAGD